MGKGFLVGFCAVPLQPAALFCAASRFTFHQRYPLLQGFSPAAPEVGSLDLEIMVGLAFSLIFYLISLSFFFEYPLG